MLCVQTERPPMRDRCEDGMTFARFSRRCLVASACYGTDAGVATLLSCEKTLDEDLGCF
jgi:hypothetical protein